MLRERNRLEPFPCAKSRYPMLPCAQPINLMAELSEHFPYARKRKTFAIGIQGNGMGEASGRSPLNHPVPEGPRLLRRHIQFRYAMS